MSQKQQKPETKNKEQKLEKYQQEQDQSELTSLLGISLGGIGSLPDHPTARSLRQAAVLQMQHQHGNAFVQTQLAGEVVQRKRMKGVLGDRLGDFEMLAEGYPLVVTAVTELVPLDQSPGRFDGYTSRIEALAPALKEQDKVCAIAEEDSGLFHTFKTNVPQPDVGMKWLFKYSGHLFKNLDLIVVATEAADKEPLLDGSLPWSKTVDKANAWYQAWKKGEIPEDFRPGKPEAERSLGELRSAIESQYVTLLGNATGITPQMIHISRSESDRDPNAINFDLNHVGEGQTHIDIASVESGSPGGQPSILVGPNAFLSESALPMVATLVHEMEHFAHGRRAIKLLKQFGDTKKVVEWLRRGIGKEKKRQRKQSLLTEDALVEEQFGFVTGGQGAAHPNTETLAHLAGFLAVYPKMRVSEDNDPYSPRFNQINKMGQFWKFADPSVQNTTMQQLNSYVSRLDEKHKADFAKHAKLMQEKPGSETNRFKMFWTRVMNDVVP